LCRHKTRAVPKKNTQLIEVAGVRGLANKLAEKCFFWWQAEEAKEWL